MTTHQPNPQLRLNARRILHKAQRFSDTRLQLAPVWTCAKRTDAELASSIKDLQHALGELEAATRQLETEEAKVSGALRGQKAVVEECLTAAFEAFPGQANRIKLVNRAFSNAGELRRMQLQAVSWEKIWETLDPKWQPIPGLTLHGFRERRLQLEGECSEAGRLWMKWRLADEICQAIAARIEQDCVAWASEAQRRFPDASYQGRLVSECLLSV